jgi:UDP:flavonoid glycosyltransferase YjiC (YdhE family)
MSSDEKTLYVSGLPEGADKDAVRSAFLPFGNVVDVNLPMDCCSQKHKGFAYVEFQSAEDATNAKDNMNNGKILGTTVRVTLAKFDEANSRPTDDDHPDQDSSNQMSKDTSKTTGNKCAIKKTILFIPLDCVGHVNSLISIADSLKHLGHRTVFLFFDPMDGGLKERGHEVYDCTEDGLQPSTPTPATEQKWDMIVNEMGKLWRASLMDNFIQTTRVGLGSMMLDIMKHDERVEDKLKLIKPDLIVIDHYFIQPAVIKYGKPWARVFSASPLALHPKAHRLPPPTLGLPTNWLDIKDARLKSTYEAYSRTVDETKMELYEKFNDYLTKEHKLDPLPLDPMSYIYDSPYLNVYMYPEELDYSHVPAPKNWVRCDSILRTNAILPPDADNEQQQQQQDATKKSTLKMPVEFTSKPGKLIFLSMGSLASGDVALMKRLVAILAKSPHKFIVSRGPNWQQYELAPNMWGEKFLPQLEVLQQIDLIITHGGNNTITECLYYGVPGFVVCPVFTDQFDNAQRIQEQGLGKRVDPFHCSETELLDTIEQVLGDQTIRERMSAIRDRMQKAENKFKAIRLFNDLVERV